MNGWLFEKINTRYHVSSFSWCSIQTYHHFHTKDVKEIQLEALRLRMMNDFFLNWGFCSRGFHFSCGVNVTKMNKHSKLHLRTSAFNVKEGHFAQPYFERKPYLGVFLDLGTSLPGLGKNGAHHTLGPAMRRACVNPTVGMAWVIWLGLCTQIKKDFLSEM